MEAFKLIARLVLNKDEFDRDFSAIDKDLNSDGKLAGFKAWGAKVGRIAGQAATAAFNAVAEFGKSAIETGMGFDAMMDRVKAVSGMTDKEFETVRKRAIELGETTEWTAEQVGEAFYYMGMAGWKSGEMLDGIEPILNLATAAGEDLGSTSDIVTDALTAMGYKAKDAAQFANVLTVAASNSNTTVGQLGEAFKYIATTGGVMGYTIDDVAVALGLLANNGIKAGQAGTSMRQILNTLIAPTDKAAAAMDALGLSLFEAGTDKRKPLMTVVNELRQIFQDADFDLGGKPMEQIQGEIDELNSWYDAEKKVLEDRKASNKEFSDLDEEYAKRMKAIAHFNEDFLGKLSDIGGLRGISSLFALMQSTDEDVNQLQEAVSKSGEGKGAAKNMAETMLDNLKGDITLLNSAMDSLKILVSDEYKDPIRKFIQTIIEGVGSISDAFKEGGLAGMFTNLVDWVINGMTDVLSNPEITVEGATNFGRALGDFVGHLVSKLIQAAPELMSGLFEAGMNLAAGLIEGLFEGLFGSGEGTVYGFMRKAEQEQNDLISDANSTAVEAQGIVNYMKTLVDKYGEAAKNSKEWADAMDRLEQLIPGITASIKEEGQELSTTTQNLSEYIEKSRQKAIADARKAYVSSIKEEYEESLKKLGSAQTQMDFAQYQQDEAARRMAAIYLQNRSHYDQSDVEYNREHGLDLFGNLSSVEEIVQYIREGNATIEDLYGHASEMYDANEEQVREINTLNESYKTATKSYNDNAKKIESLTNSAETLQIQLGLAEAAAERMTAEMSQGTTSPAMPQAKGDWYVPYDNYPSLLHRGEMVLTASQARKYRDGAGNAIDIPGLRAAIVGAVQDGMRNAQVTAYMDGRRVTNEVARIMNNQMALAR